MHRKICLYFVKLLLLISPALSYSQQIPVSPVRAPNQSWEEALRNNMPAWGESVLDPEISLLQDITPDTIGGVPEWPYGLLALNSFVYQVRHARFYNNPNPGDYKRKAPWLYPIDGCYAKAAHVSAQASIRGYKRPGKVFAFGHLRFNSPYSSRGRVFWSYHVAAAYHIGSTVYVIDPMVSGSAALTLDQWIGQLSSTPERVKVKLCDENAYSPSNRCIGSKNNGAYLGHIPFLLKSEYSNLRRLGFDAKSLLAQ